MTQEEKQMLLKDLSARLSYGVIIRNEEGYEGHLNSINQTIFGIELGVNITATRRVDFQMDTCKPYLRPMSSMTEEETNEYNEQIDKDTVQIGKVFETPNACMVGLNALDWLNAHHFDYRGLIERGLALEAKEGMYKYKIRNMSWYFYPEDRFSSYEEYVKYLKEKGLAFEAPNGLYKTE